MKRLDGFARLQQFDALLVFLGAEGDGDQRLGFAAGEQGRAVGARQHAGLDGDGPDLVEGAAIRTAVLLQHLVAEDPLLQRVVDLGGFVPLLFRQLRRALLLDLGNLGVAFELGIFLGVQSVFQLVADCLCDLCRKFPD